MSAFGNVTRQARRVAQAGTGGIVCRSQGHAMQVARSHRLPDIWSMPMRRRTGHVVIENPTEFVWLAGFKGTVQSVTLEERAG